MKQGAQLTKEALQKVGKEIKQEVTSHPIYRELKKGAKKQLHAGSGGRTSGSGNNLPGWQGGA